MTATTAFPTKLFLDLPNWVGDTMMALPSVARLVDANRSGHTLIHTRPSMRTFIESLWPGAAVLVSEKKTSPLRTALRAGRRADIGVTFRNAYRAKILLFFAARRRFGSPGQGARCFLTEICAPDRNRHQVHDPAPILAALGIDPDVPPRFEFPPELVVEGRALFEPFGFGNRPIVGLAPGSASGISRRWPVERFAALATALDQAGVQPIVLIGPGEGPLGAAIRNAGGGDLPVMGEDLDVLGLAAVCTGMDAVVGVDSGPVHLASLAGSGAIALFGPTDAARTAPASGNARVLELGLDCSPCRRQHCPLEHHQCMMGITVDDVLQAVLTRLDERAGFRSRSKRSAVGA